MNALFVAVFAILAALAASAPSGTIVAGPAGVVTGHGAIGPVAHHGLGWAGHGWAGHGWAGNGWAGHGAVIAGPVAHAAVVAPIAHGAWGHGYAHGAWGHGVTVQGPPTAPAVIAGPSGKIVADGLWGPTGHIGHHW